MSKMPRRSFIGRLTSGIIMVGSTSLILKPKNALALSNPGGTFGGTYDVKVCYRGYKVKDSAPTEARRLYKGPLANPTSSPNLEDWIVGGTAAHVTSFAWRSKRLANRDTSQCASGRNKTKMNAIVWKGGWGYVWVNVIVGSSATSNKSGWVIMFGNSNVNQRFYSAVTNSTPNGDYVLSRCHGPAFEDWDCLYGTTNLKAADEPSDGSNPRGRTSGFGNCGGYQAQSLSGSGGDGQLWYVGNASASDERSYLRFAPNSTPFGWLSGTSGFVDKVRRLSETSDSRIGGGLAWTYVKIPNGRFLTDNIHGWIRTGAISSKVP